jgi:hypothetical protein
MSTDITALEGVIQLEAIVTEAAREVERCDAAEEKAAEEVSRIEREMVEIEANLLEADDAQQKAAIDRVGAYWSLGRAITNLETALATNKGKHSANTPRKRAIELAGNNSRYQRAKSIGSFFNNKADAEQVATTRSFNAILTEIAEKKATDRKAKGQEAPGRKPTKTPVKPVARKTPATNVPATDEDEVADEEESETTQPFVTPEEVKAVETFVAMVGGWSRAVYLVQKGYQKWKENQK